MKSRYFWGTVTMVAIVGGTIYAIKKSKDAKKSDEYEITLEEAKVMLEEHRLAKMDESTQEFEELVDDVRDEASWNRSFMPYPEEEEKTGVKDDNDDEELDEEEFSTLAEEDFRFVGDGNINPKEDLDLRHDPNSVEAKHQYIRMELADWSPIDYGYRVLLKLFDFPFIPQNDGDEMLRTQIIDFKVQFFGFESKWVKDITIADIILHYARAAEFNVGNNVRFWAEYFLEFNGFDADTPSHTIDELLKLLNSHAYFNEERHTFGLFGLTPEAMDQAIKIASRNIDRSVTYEIEFNEFLKSCI